jgi:integrase
MATLRKHPRSPYWQAVITLPDGRRTNRSTKCRDRKKAIRVAQQLEDVAIAAREGRLVSVAARKTISDIYRLANKEELPSATVREYLAGWLERKKLEVRESTHERYQHNVKLFLRYTGRVADKELLLLTSTDVAAFRNDVAQDKAAKTVNHALGTLKSALDQAVTDGFMDTNVARTVQNLKAQPNERQPFTMKQVEQMLKVSNQEWQGMILSGLYTGLRLGDIAKLTWANVSGQELHLTVQKTGKPITIPLAAPLFDCLMKLPTEDDPMAPLFPEALDAYRRCGDKANTLSTQFRGIMEAAGIVEPRPWKSTGKGRHKQREFCTWSFHSLRHTFVTWAKEANVSQAVVQALVGHASEAVNRLYTHVGDEALRAAINKLPTLKETKP